MLNMLETEQGSMAARHEHIASDLRRLITEGVYALGTHLPTETELALSYEVSRATIRQAVTALQLEGLVDSRQGARRVVLRATPAQDVASRENFSQWAARNGRTPGGLMLKRSRQAATETEAVLFEAAVGEPVLHVLRLRTLDGEPILVERSRFVRRHADIIESLPLDTPSFSAAFEAGHTIEVHVDHLIDVVAAEPADATLLGVEQGSQLLRHRYLLHTASGEIFGDSDDRYKPGAMTFSLGSVSRALACRMKS